MRNAECGMRNAGDVGRGEALLLHVLRMVHGF